MNRCTTPCCGDGIVLPAARHEATAVYVLISDGELMPHLALLYPIALVRPVLAPFLSEPWRRELGCSYPFADQHLRQAAWWLLACTIGTAGTVTLLSAGLLLLPADTRPIGLALTIGVLLLAPFVWLAGHVLGAVRASGGGWKGPPLVGWLVGGAPCQAGSARVQPPKASSSAPAAAIDT